MFRVIHSSQNAKHNNIEKKKEEENKTVVEMYPFPETAEREQQMGKIVIEDVGAVIGIVATVDEVKCQLLRNLWLPFALPKSASFLDPFLQNNDVDVVEL